MVTAQSGDVAAKSALLVQLQRFAEEFGLTPIREAGPDLRAEAQVIRAGWWLGQNRVRYRMSCRLDEAARTVHFREVVIESSWGLPPPTWISERTTIKGTQRFGSLTYRSPVGGGRVDYERVRGEIEQIVREAGWQFVLDATRLP
jgi:hypothetical protein